MDSTLLLGAALMGALLLLVEDRVGRIERALDTRGAGEGLLPPRARRLQAWLVRAVLLVWIAFWGLALWRSAPA